ncbi:hypothetical protein L204_100679 [Cryptococcus depauperatus]|nr:RNA exonuclease 1 [Cryptococcus depauperatus CBS 7855]
MFSNLGLFSTSVCPDRNCSRVRCLFSHSPLPLTAPTSFAGPSKTTAASKIRDVSSKVDGIGVKRKVEETCSKTPQRDNKKTVVVASTRPPLPTPMSVAAKKPTISALANNSELGKPPVLPFIRSSPQPRTDRQKALNTLYTQFSKLYASILHLSPSLAHESTLAQESEISSLCSSLTAYKSAIHHAAVSISRRPLPDQIPHHSIGTVKESRAATETHEKEKAGELKRDRVERYCLRREDFEKWGYPDPDNSLLVGEETDTIPDGEGELHLCDRCKVQFVVSSKNLQERLGECRYHYGRTAPERVEGRRKWIYSCCRKERGEQGCEEGIHVFRDGEDDEMLAKRVKYKTVKQCAEEAERSGKEVVQGFSVVAMDCEMIYTTAGSSLGRVTIVDQNGSILFDDLVRQTVPVLDLNTRFSGITPEDLGNALMDLPAARASACMFIGPETIIVGHGLENDLRALRLLHDKVIDTAVIFPHEKGAPYRRALRDIVKEKLGIFIQDRTSDKGHSSLEDAKATLDVLKWKVREDSQ